MKEHSNLQGLELTRSLAGSTTDQNSCLSKKTSSDTFEIDTKYDT